MKYVSVLGVGLYFKRTLWYIFILFQGQKNDNIKLFLAIYCTNYLCLLHNIDQIPQQYICSHHLICNTAASIISYSSIGVDIPQFTRQKDRNDVQPTPHFFLTDKKVHFYSKSGQEKSVHCWPFTLFEKPACSILF